ncbi:MAG: TonB-dependent receptor plug [Bacteroidetes bacterium]|nr:TonB-dependent receptor plug [Bacteroidota bacterium]
MLFTKIKYFILTTLFFIVGISFSQNITISGYIKDAETGESLIGATVYSTKTKTGASANTYGFYSLSLPKGDSTGLVFTYVGYSAQIKKVILTSNIELNIKLFSSLNQLTEVTVISKKTNDNVESPRMGVIDIPIQKIKELPAILGETDVLKVIQLLPGVQSGNEGTTGFFVRGGNSDQNLVQLDEAVVYNPNHLFGLFSTFNTKALNNVTLIKGGFPAQYGGRLSSILDITMKEGNNQKFKVEGGVGLISSNLTIEGPIVKEKASFIISARRTYLDLLIKPFLPKNISTTYNFYDLNAKINWQISKRDRLFLSAFRGNDKAGYTEASSINYGIRFGNSTATLRWNHLFGQKLFVNTSLIYNTYLLNLSTIQGKFYAQVYSGIKDVNGKSEFQYYPNSKHKIMFGANYIYHSFSSSGKSEKLPKDSQVVNIQPNRIPARYASEMALYLNDEYTLSKRVALSAGIRTPAFITKNVSYFTWEPRATIKVSLDSFSSIKVAYTVMNQFLHIIPSSSASLPFDLWIPSSNITKPERSQQFALGYFKNFKDNSFESSVELYYKTMQNQVAFKEGTQILEQTNIDSSLVFGKGWSYGAEFFIKKNVGKFTGWIAYTLSWTFQQFKDLNYGEKFPFKYDRRHVLSVVGTYNLNKHWILSADFVFSTGSAYTLPAARINLANGGSLYDGVYYVYDKRNNYRLNAYHRMDIGATYRKNKTMFKGKVPFVSEWVFSIYNVYSHRNPYFVYLTVDPVSQEPKAKQVSLLPIIPGISYNFKF